jgi:hypothetical protein
LRCKALYAGGTSSFAAGLFHAAKELGTDFESCSSV